MQETTPISFFAEIQGRTEEFRHECEVRWVAALDTDAHRSIYLSGVYEKRGRAVYERLRRDVWDHMKRAATDVIPIQETLAL